MADRLGIHRLLLDFRVSSSSFGGSCPFCDCSPFLSFGGALPLELGWLVRAAASPGEQTRWLQEVHVGVCGLGAARHYLSSHITNASVTPQPSTLTSRAPWGYVISGGALQPSHGQGQGHCLLLCCSRRPCTLLGGYF